VKRLTIVDYYPQMVNLKEQDSGEKYTIINCHLPPSSREADCKAQATALLAWINKSEERISHSNECSQHSSCRLSLQQKQRVLL